MASCITEYWNPNNNTPRVRLTVTQSSETATTATLAWKLDYVASAYAVSTSKSHAYTAVVNGTTVCSGSYAIGGKTGTHTIKSGSITVDKTTSSKAVAFSCSMDFSGITWSGTYAGSNEKASGSITISAKTSYIVKYNANGGAGAPSSQTKWHGTTLKLSSVKPTRTGYSFQGWSKTSTGSVAYAAGANYTANATIILFAVWKANTYTVAYNANGGTGAPGNQTKTYGVTLRLSTTIPTRTNYTFKGWATSSSGSVVYAAGANYTSNAGVTLYAVWELGYKKPRITNLTATRCDAAGNPTEDGTYAKVSFEWATDKAASAMTISAMSASTENPISSFHTLFGGTSGVASEVIGDDETSSNALSTEITYTIVVSVSDENESNSKSVTLPGTIYTIDCKAGGTGVSFGKPAELDKFADFGWDACFNNFLGIHGRDLNGNIKQVFQPQNENGNTVIGWDNYDTKSGNTNVYGHDVNIGVSNISSPDTFRPYRRQGDTVRFNSLRTAGYVTNSGKDVTFLVPFAVPIIGSPTATVTSLAGFVLRQGEAYTHGSSSTTFVVPDSYSTTVSAFVGVYVTAHFSNTTNVINNAPIGIYWGGQIAFSTNNNEDSG